MKKLSIILVLFLISCGGGDSPTESSNENGSDVITPPASTQDLLGFTYSGASIYGDFATSTFPFDDSYARSICFSYQCDIGDIPTEPVNPFIAESGLLQIPPNNVDSTIDDYFVRVIKPLNKTQKGDVYVSFKALYYEDGLCWQGKYSTNPNCINEPMRQDYREAIALVFISQEGDVWYHNYIIFNFYNKNGVDGLIQHIRYDNQGYWQANRIKEDGIARVKNGEFAVLYSHNPESNLVDTISVFENGSLIKTINTGQNVYVNGSSTGAQAELNISYIGLAKTGNANVFVDDFIVYHGE